MSGGGGQYTVPEDSGLIGVRAYPAADDVCQVIGENDITRDLLDDSALLIGCPVHEQGAIDNRLAEGARPVGSAGDWRLFSVPFDSELPIFSQHTRTVIQIDMQVAHYEKANKQ